MQPYTRNILRRDGTPRGDREGKVHLYVEDIHSPLEPKTIRVDLYNYWVDGNVPRPEHRQWLREQLFPFLREFRYHVHLLGRASRSGPWWANRRVSRERVLLLKEHLVEEGGLAEAQVPGVEMREQGDLHASRQEADSERDRCVQMVLAPGWRTRPVRRQKVRIGVPGQLPIPDRSVTLDDSTNPVPGHVPCRDCDAVLPTYPYKIRYLGGYEGGFLGGAGKHRFEIMDPRTGDRMQFSLTVIGAMTPGGSYAPHQENGWSDFHSNARSLDRFHGRTTTMGTFQIGPYSRAGVQILGSNRVEIDTGIGMSAGKVGKQIGGSWVAGELDAEDGECSQP